MDAGSLVLLASLAGSLVLAGRAIRSHNLSFETKSWMVVAWILLIGILAFVASRLGA